jgi:PAS domain S-box-containing protein
VHERDAPQAAEAIKRQLAEDALRTSEERFRRYFELGLIGMASTSPSKGILEANDELCRILGYPRQELLHKTWAELTHPDDLAADVVQFERVMAGEIDGYSLEKRWVRKNGDIVHGVMSARCKRRAGGAVDYFVGLLLDITERKRAEERLRRSEAYLAQAERLSHTGSWALNIATGEMFWSEEHFRIVGLESVAGVPGYPLALKVIHADDRLFVVEALERAMREKSEFETDCRVVRPDGTVRFIRSIAQPVFNQAREVSEYVGSIIDITEARQAEEKVAESERRFRLLAETLPQHVWIYDANGKANYFNQRWLDYTGMTWEEARGNGGHAIVHPEDRPALEAVWRQVSAEKKSFESEVRLRKKSGEYRRFVIRGAPFFSDLGELLEWHGTNTDVEDCRRAQEELENAQEELARVTQITAMGEMAAAIAHEINQPLGAIVNNSNYCLGLLGQPQAEKKKRAALQDIVADANRASAIIQRIRGLTNGAKHITMTLNFAELLEEVINLCQRSLTEHQIKVKTAVGKNLPRLRADRVQIQQVLFNLVTNAIAAMSETEDGVVSIRVARGKVERDPAILVTVTDNGIGFAPGIAERMFDAFYTTKEHGMGMGLRVSRSIAEKYGGSLTAQQNEDRGATFSFLLPADESD